MISHEGQTHSGAWILEDLAVLEQRVVAFFQASSFEAVAGMSFLSFLDGNSDFPGIEKMMGATVQLRHEMSGPKCTREAVEAVVLQKVEELGLQGEFGIEALTALEVFLPTAFMSGCLKPPEEGSHMCIPGEAWGFIKGILCCGKFGISLMCEISGTIFRLLCERNSCRN